MEEAIISIEEIYSTKKSLFKKPLTQQDIEDRKKNASTCISKAEKGLAKKFPPKVEEPKAIEEIP